MDEPTGAPRPRRRRALTVGLACALILALSCLSATAWGAFADQASAEQTVRTATLQPPTLLTTEPGVCVIGANDSIVLTWTASTTVTITGYEILRATAVEGPYSLVATVNGSAAETYADTPLPFTTPFHYVVRSFRSNWRSVQTGVVSRTTRSSSCL
jgi:hypothetical protein